MKMNSNFKFHLFLTYIDLVVKSVYYKIIELRLFE